MGNVEAKICPKGNCISTTKCEHDCGGYFCSTHGLVISHGPFCPTQPPPEAPQGSIKLDDDFFVKLVIVETLPPVYNYSYSNDLRKWHTCGPHKIKEYCDTHGKKYPF